MAFNVKITEETAKTLKNMLGVEKATLNLKEQTISLSNMWEVQKLSEKVLIEDVDGKPYKPVIEGDISDKMREELDKLYSNEPHIGTIFEKNNPGFDGYYVLLKNAPNGVHVIARVDLLPSADMITLPGIDLRSEDVLFKGSRKYGKMILRDNCCGIYDWPPSGGSKIIGRVVNLDKLQPVIEKAENFITQLK